MVESGQNMAENNKKEVSKETILEKNAAFRESLGQKNPQSSQAPQTPETKIKELTETLQRLQAEFENFQKRQAKQNDDFKCYANAKLIEELLPVLDSLEVGMKHSKDLVIVHEQILGILKKNGVTKIKAESGNNFDHDSMECLMQETIPSLKDGVVAKVLMSGYLLNGKVLRAAKVSVNAVSAGTLGAGSLEKKKETPAVDAKDSKVESKDKKIETKEELTKVDYTIQKMESD
jgi:molecular chaperone GrpE